MPLISLRLPLLVLTTLLATAGCQSKQSEAQVPAADRVSDEVASATAPVPAKENAKVGSPTAPSSAGDKIVAAPKVQELIDPKELEKMLCKKQKKCEIIKTWDAGKDEQNQPVQVVELTLDPKSAKRAEPGQRFYYGKEGQAFCFPIQYWLVRPTLINAANPGNQPALILEFCPKGGEFDIYSENEVVIEPGRFTYKIGGGMGEQYGEEKTIGLPSLQHIRFTYYSWHKLLRPSEYVVWEHDKLRGKTSGFVLDCENQDKQDRTEEEDEDNYAYQPIPVVSLPKAFRSGGWKSTGLGSCSSTINSLDKESAAAEFTGFITHGKPGSAGDAGFQVVMASPTEMYVEVSDDTWIETAGSVLHTDHLELWARTEIVCPKPNKSLFQWGIALDGKVETFYGKPGKSPTAESVSIQNADGTRTRRFKITLPESYGSLTVVYSDSDDGKTQKRLIATSKVKFKNQFTLGSTKNIPASEGVCTVEQNTLQYSPNLQKPKSPVFEY